MQNSLKDLYTSLILVGAYGRVYKTKKAAITDWEAGKDFKIQGGPYCSIRDITVIADTACAVLISTQQGHVQVA